MLVRERVLTEYQGIGLQDGFESSSNDSRLFVVVVVVVAVQIILNLPMFSILSDLGRLLTEIDY